MLTYLIHLARKQGLLSFIADVLFDNISVLRIFEKMDFNMQKHFDTGMYQLKMMFRGTQSEGQATPVKEHRQDG